MRLRSELHRVAYALLVSLAVGCQAPNPNFALGVHDGNSGEGGLDARTDLSGGGGGGAGGLAGGSGGSGGVSGGYGGQGGFPSGTGGGGPATGGAGGAGGGSATDMGGPDDVGGAGGAGVPTDSGLAPDSAGDTVVPPADMAPPPPDLPPDAAAIDAPPPDTGPVDAANPPQEGLMAYYYRDRNQTMLFAGPLLDMNVDDNWGPGAPLAGMPTDGFAVKWTGVLVPRVTGTYTFYTNSDDGARFKLGTETLIDKYQTQSLTEWPSFKNVALIAGVHYPIVVEFFDGSYTARMHLSWAAPGAGLAKEIIPRSALLTQ
jgi:hypothetical protein